MKASKSQVRVFRRVHARFRKRIREASTFIYPDIALDGVEGIYLEDWIASLSEDVTDMKDANIPLIIHENEETMFVDFKELRRGARHGIADIKPLTYTLEEMFDYAIVINRRIPLEMMKWADTCDVKKQLGWPERIQKL